MKRLKERLMVMFYVGKVLYKQCGKEGTTERRERGERGTKREREGWEEQLTTWGEKRLLHTTTTVVIYD